MPQRTCQFALCTTIRAIALGLDMYLRAPASLAGGAHRMLQFIALSSTITG
jgi:hypothetical protein